MHDVFIDTDVIIDLLTDRKPFSQEAVKLFSLIEQGVVRGHASSLSFSNLYYVLRKFESHAKVISTIETLMQLINIIDVNDKVIREAIRSNFRDFEDGIQYHAALNNGNIGIIITRNQKDFKKSQIPVMTPGEFLSAIEQL